MSRVWTAARVVFTLALVGVVIARIVGQWDAVKQLHAHPTLLDASVAIITGLLAYVGLAVLFAVTLELAGHHRPGHRLFHLRLWLQPYLYKYVPGKVMVAVERVRLGKLVGLPGAELVLLLLWESVFLLVGAALVLAVAFAFARVEPNGQTWWMVPSFVGAFALLLLFPLLLRLAAKIPPLTKRMEGLGSMRFTFAAQTLLVLGYAAVWMCFATSFLFFCRFFMEIDGTRAAAVIFWYVAAYVAGFVSSITPGGVGVREGILTVGLASVLGPAEAAALAVAGRIFTTILELLCTGAAWLIPIPSQPTPPGEPHG